MWLNGPFGDVFHRAKDLQLRLRESRVKQKDVIRNFDHHITYGKIFNALRCLEDQRRHILSLSDKVDNCEPNLARKTSRASRQKKITWYRIPSDKLCPFTLQS